MTAKLSEEPADELHEAVEAPVAGAQPARGNKTSRKHRAGADRPGAAARDPEWK